MEELEKLQDLTEERANELLKNQGYLFISQVYDIWNDVLRENGILINYFEGFIVNPWKEKEVDDTFIDFKHI